MTDDRKSPQQTTRTSHRELAREFIESIAEGSPEDDARIWFENAPHEVRMAAFIKLDVKDRKP